MKDHCNKAQKITNSLTNKIIKRKVAPQLISFSDASELRSYKKLLAQRIIQDFGNNYFKN
ncbi:unnamed protein product [Paramecium pentaurelia]|uniref:Uncharacterized protein n=1 Tax=Paramecium pentaurelia TaxID=43138 RepID=A0A8S1U9J3_9CILI|nr:unnamed protein product [Paramecium pentaurelia]